MNKIKMSLVAAIAAAAATTGANAGALDNVLSNPKLDIELRPRYETVDDGANKDASALTIRTAVGVQAGLFGVDGLNAQLQAMSVDHLGLVADYNPVNSDYATIADGPQTRMTQANISYANNGFVGIVGRKMVVLDNARFIGNVGWRQMPQTYDLAAAVYNYDKLSLLGAYVTRVNRIFNASGNGALKDHFDTATVLLHATYNVMPELTLTAYDYMVENLFDHIGIRATGKVNAGNVKLAYEAEYTTQNDPSMTDADDAARTGIGSADIKQDASYYKVGLNATMNEFTVGAAYEFLSDNGDGKLAFWTPLATLHAMNGWADVFLTTPQSGLTDMSVKLAYNAGDYGKVVGVYHSFSSDSKNASGNDDLGSEVDVAYSYKINKQLGMLLKGAWYSKGDDGFKNFLGKSVAGNDVTKYWIQFDYKFHAEL